MNTITTHFNAGLYHRCSEKVDKQLNVVYGTMQ